MTSEAAMSVYKPKKDGGSGQNPLVIYDLILILILILIHI
jgi:hypothetical protein